MNTLDKAIDRVRKLLALAKSDNPNEAAQAAARAQEILDRYELDAAMIESTNEEESDHEEIENFHDKSAPLYMSGKMPVWRSCLARSISEANGCIVLLYPRSGGGKTIDIIGRASDVQKVRYLFSYLAREVDRLAERDGRGCGRTWINNYRLGAIETVGAALVEAHNKVRADMRSGVAGNSQALMVVNTAIAKVETRSLAARRWAKDNIVFGRTSGGYGVRSDPDARERGRKAGREIGINNARGALGAGSKKLGA